MNINFENTENCTRFLDLMPCDDQFEGMNINEGVLNTLDKAFEQFKNVEPSFRSNIEKNENKVCSTPLSIKFDSALYEYQDEAANNHSLLFNNISSESNSSTKGIVTTMCYNSSTNTCQAKSQYTQMTKNGSKHFCYPCEQTKSIEKSIQNKTEVKSSTLISNQVYSNTQIFNAKNHRKRKSGYRRWGRNEDCLLFKNLSILCKESGMNIEDYWNKDTFLSDQHLNVLESIADSLKWKSESSILLKRVQILGRDQSISVRQKHLLRKLYYQTVRQKREFTIESIVDMFPGKSISTLQSAFDKIKVNFREMHE